MDVSRNRARSKRQIFRSISNLNFVFRLKQGDEEEGDAESKKESDENKNQPIYHHSECETHCRKNSQITKCMGRCPSRPSLVRSVSDVGRGTCQQLATYHSKVKSLPDLASKCSEALCEYRPEKVVRYNMQHFSAKDSEPEKEPT